MQCTSWIFMCFIVVVHWMLANLASNHSQTIVIVGRPLSVLITVFIQHSLLDFKPNMLHSFLDSPQSLAMFCRKIRLKFHEVPQRLSRDRSSIPLVAEILGHRNGVLGGPR